MWFSNLVQPSASSRLVSILRPFDGQSVRSTHQERSTRDRGLQEVRDQTDRSRPACTHRFHIAYEVHDRAGTDERVRSRQTAAVSSPADGAARHFAHRKWHGRVDRCLIISGASANRDIAPEASRRARRAGPPANRAVRVRHTDQLKERKAVLSTADTAERQLKWPAGNPPPCSNDHSNPGG